VVRRHAPRARTGLRSGVLVDCWLGGQNDTLFTALNRFSTMPGKWRLTRVEPVHSVPLWPPRGGTSGREIGSSAVRGRERPERPQRYLFRPASATRVKRIHTKDTDHCWVVHFVVAGERRRVRRRVMRRPCRAAPVARRRGAMTEWCVSSSDRCGWRVTRPANSTSTEDRGRCPD